MSLPVNDIVRVSAVIVEQGLLRRDFGISLFLTTDETLRGGAGRVQKYADFGSVSEAFAVGTEPYEAANIHFQQKRAKNLIIARWIDTDIGAALFGGAAATLATYQAITDGTLTMFFDGIEVDITAMDFSGASSFADVATEIQTSVGWPAAYPVTFNAVNGTFEILGSVVGIGETLSFATPEGSGTDVSDLLGFTASKGGALQQGQDAELVEDALDAIKALNNEWYFLTLETSLWDTTTVVDVANYVAAQPYFFFADSANLGVLTTGETSSVPYQLKQLAQDRVCMTWSATKDYKGLAAAAILGAVNYAGSNTLITLKFKTLEGTISDSISPTQKTELDSKNTNLYTLFSTIADSDSIYVEGVTMKDGTFCDVRAFLDFFIDAVQTSVYNLLRQSGRVPQTNAGVTALQGVINGVCRQSITNGGIAPGQLSAATQLDIEQTTGVTDFDGFLTNGYLTYTTPLADQPQSDRNQRKAPPTKVWLKGAGAVHFVDIDVIFEN